MSAKNDVATYYFFMMICFGYYSRKINKISSINSCNMISALNEMYH